MALAATNGPRLQFANCGRSISRLETIGMRSFAVGFGAVVLLLVGLGQARADFLETFNSGSATYTTGDPSYWLDQTNAANGFIITTTDQTAVYPGHPDYFSAASGFAITHDVSGSGYFLFDSTNTNVPSGAGDDEFYIS